MNREVGDSEGEGKTLRNVGILFLQQQQYEAALASILLAKRILDGLQSPYRDSVQEWIDALRKEVGEEQFEVLVEKVGAQAPQIVKEAIA